MGEGGRCFEQIAFGCVVDLYSGEWSCFFWFLLSLTRSEQTGSQHSCLFTQDHDSKMYEISQELSQKLFDPSDERPPINLPSQGGPPMPLFQRPPPSSFPQIRHKNSFSSFTTSATIPTSPPCPPSTQSTSTHNGLIPVSGEFLERAQAYYKSGGGLRHCLRARRMGKAAMVNSMDNWSISGMHIFKQASFSKPWTSTKPQLFFFLFFLTSTSFVNHNFISTNLQTKLILIYRLTMYLSDPFETQVSDSDTLLSERIDTVNHNKSGPVWDSVRKNVFHNKPSAIYSARAPSISNRTYKIGTGQVQNWYGLHIDLDNRGGISICEASKEP